MATVIRNILGYLATLLRSRLKLADRSTSLEDIFNYLELDNRITTSGQPSATQLGLIKAAGYTTIINLAPKAQENALEDEEEILQRLGIRYFTSPSSFQGLPGKTLNASLKPLRPATMNVFGYIAQPTCECPPSSLSTERNGSPGR